MQEVTITVTRILSNHRIDPYNTKLILSCLKQTLTLTLTLTLGLVTPTGAIMPEEVDGAEEALAVAETIADRIQSLDIHSFEGKMNDGPLSKLIITEGGQQAT